jgi:Ran GTPase-activating protein (RanGAP) involved in mRNA processing and transport
MQMLDLKSICALAKCNRSLKKDAESRFALATQCTFRVETHMLGSGKANHQVGLLQYHPDINVMGSCETFNEVPDTLIHNLARLGISIPYGHAPGLEEKLTSARRLQQLTLSCAEVSDNNNIVTYLFRTLKEREKIDGTTGLRTMTIISKIFGEEDTNELVIYLADASKLVKLTLMCCTFKKESLQILANGIVKSRSIDTLNLGASALGQDAELALSKILRGCPSLTSLNLSDTRGGSYNQYYQLEALASAVMDENCNLQSLNIAHNDLIGNAAIAFAPMISKLRTLNLSNNEISNTGIRAIGDALKISKTITDINLSNNLWTAVGMEDILVFLSNLAANKSLQRLGLYGCAIGTAEFLLHLKTALLGKVELRELNLGDNFIDDGDCQHVAEIMTGCHSLEILDLWNNKIGGVGMIAIAAALPQAKNLQQLDLEWNGVVDDASATVLFKAIQDHPRLTRVSIAEDEYGFHIGDLARPVLASLKPDRIQIESF